MSGGILLPLPGSGGHIPDAGPDAVVVGFVQRDELYTQRITVLCQTLGMDDPGPGTDRQGFRFVVVVQLEL